MVATPTINGIKFSSCDNCDNWTAIFRTIGMRIITNDVQRDIQRNMIYLIVFLFTLTPHSSDSVQKMPCPLSQLSRC